MKTAEIRRLFLDFFHSQEHKVLPSSTLVPDNDPTLLFTNAGMVPFKDIFTGLKPRSYPQVTTAQKCVRAGGKHNDLDQVGYTARHHTFFEMLGNFSFGAYFKEEAIRFAWTFLTQELRLPKERLCVTIYHEDTEAADLWQKIAGVMPIPITTNDNFWTMGDMGPCGPCSEIFYDHGATIPGGPPGSPEADGDRFVEIWNLVFMQFNQQAEDLRVPLPKPSIDTGMGLERIAAVMQGVTDNYDIDIFRVLRKELAAFTKVPDTAQNRPSYKVVADHLRAAAFLCAEGVIPGPDGRSYVLRRIIRRAIRHGHGLGIREPFFYKLVPVLVQEMGEGYPELRLAETVIQEILKQEEQRFRTTLERGLLLLENEIKALPSGGTLPGTAAFKLYDTYGFPLDLTEALLRDRGLQLDKEAFVNALKEQQTRAQWAGSGDRKGNLALKALTTRLPATRFCGYDKEETTASILGLVHGTEEVTQANAGEEIYFCLDVTPFYATSGGQQADQGALQASQASACIQDVQKTAEGVFWHIGHVISGTFSVGDSVVARWDKKRREQTAAHHSATHLLQAALRQALGEQVTQKGSFVDAERLRFDFNAPGPLSPEKLEEVETCVNRWIHEDLPVVVSEQEKSAALAAGATALFSEKYQDRVRVVQMGLVSKELCGGTHVSSTGHLGLFCLLSEGGIGSGVRRIEALAGEAAYQYVQRMQQSLKESARLLNTTEENLPMAIAEILSERERLRRKSAQQQAMKALSTDILEETVGEAVFLCQKVATVAPQDIRHHIDVLKKGPSPRLAIVLSEEENRTRVYVGVSEGLKEKCAATNLLNALLSLLQEGGGGGRPDFAQGGGRGLLAPREVLAFAKKFYLH
ncbi:MAG: alanine--tRNA ligase [Holosporales bacterium]|jgi:alanyl-tRNA synthetase|nr:alanine--tRNA ligase [Holosporales bacterium]